MSMSIQSSGHDLGYTQSADFSRLIEKLHVEHPNLRIEEYNKLAADSMNMREELERYVREWFMQLISPDYSKAQYADLHGPDDDSLEETESFPPALLNPETMWLLADPSVIDIPDSVRKDLIKRLETETGLSYAVAQTRFGLNDEPVASISSSKMSSGAENGGTQSGGYDLSGLQGSDTDVARVVNFFPPDSFAGGMFSLLGDKVLLSRNVTTQSALALSEISKQEHEIMEELANLRNSGLSADDPEYLTRMEELKMQSGNLSSSKEMYMAYIKQAAESVQELTSVMSEILNKFNQSMNQIAGNFGRA